MTLGAQVNHMRDERLFVGVDILNELAQTVAAEERLLAGLAFAVELTHVGEMEGNARIEEREVAQAVGEGVVVVDVVVNILPSGLNVIDVPVWSLLPAIISSVVGLPQLYS